MIEAAPAGNAPASRKADLLTYIELNVAILLTATVLLFIAMRAIHAGALWRDEAATFQLSQMPSISEIATNFQHEAFPLPFPLLIRGYSIIFGGSDASLRWFGFAVGVALIAAAWFNSRSVRDRGPMLFLGLFGLNATFLLWGTSLRGYGLGCVFLILTIGYTALAIRKPSRTGALATTLMAIGSVQFMINAVPLIAAIGAAAIAAFAVEREFRRALVVCACGAVCALSFIPYLHSYLSADWNIVLKYPTDFASLSEKFQFALQDHSWFAAVLWYAAVPFLIIVAIWKWLSFKRQKNDPSLYCPAEGEAGRSPADESIWRRQESEQMRVFLFLVAVSIFSVVAYYGFLKLLSYATRPWYYLPLLCAVAAAIDLMGGILSSLQWFRIARIVMAIAAGSLLPPQLWSVAHQRMTDIDILAKKLENEAAPNDLIVINPWHFAPSFYRYYHGSTPWITVPTMSEHRVHRYDLMKSKMVETDPLADVRARIQETLQAHHRVWIVGGARPLDPNMPQLGPAPNPYFGW